jgi:hypothetical protein
VFLVWEVVTRSLAAYLADASPESALGIRSNYPIALLNLAEKELKRNQDTESEEQTVSALANDAAGKPKKSSNSDPAKAGPVRSVSLTSRSRARSWTEQALINDPLNARAFNMLGHLSNYTSDKRQTEVLMKAAVRRSLHQSAAVYWMMRRSYERENYHAALRYADTLLRTRSQTIKFVTPILGKIAELEEGGYELKKLLATNPPWRPEFFYHFPKSIADARTPLAFLLSLKDTSAPPSSADLRSYLSFLIEHKFYDLAYYAWLQFLPPAQLSKTGYLFNGSFETASSGLPFDWVFTKTAGATTRIAMRADAAGEHALALDFGPGRVNFRGIRQLIVLAPGNYQFQGKHKLDIVSQRGLKWGVICANGTLIGESPLANGSRPGWREFEFSFTVPSSNCPAQYVQLSFDARSASERFISGSVWYDDFRIVREEDEEPLSDADGKKSVRIQDPSKPQ